MIKIKSRKENEKKNIHYKDRVKIMKEFILAIIR